MKFFSKTNLQFIKKNPQLIYGVMLLILIPAALFINTLIFFNSTQNVLDEELRRKTLLAEKLINPQVLNYLSDTSQLQAFVEETASVSGEMYGIDIFVPEGEDFKVIASLDKDTIGSLSKYHYINIAWREDGGVAYDTHSASLSTLDEYELGDKRYWVVLNSVVNDNGDKVALVAIKMSSQFIEDLYTQAQTQSIIVLIVSIIIVILLLWNNMRLFQYAILFKKLKEVDEMKDEFISMASHELRAPITGIRGYLNMMLDKTFGEFPKEAEEKLRLVMSESDRLADLVEDLLEVSRITQGRMKLEIKPVAVGAIINSVIKNFDQQAKDKNLQLVTDIKSDLPQINADENKLKQILVNLLSNAIKYTLKGKVTVSAELKIDKRDWVKIKVSDTGIGMSAKAREKLFEKFYRVKDEKTKNVTGTGLGLWITRELIVMMKGEIYVDSIENRGTEMTILFPVIKK